MRWRWALGAFVILLVADSLTKIFAPDAWIYQVSDSYWLIIDNPHEGLALGPEWTDIVLLGFLFWGPTRLAAAVVIAGSVGNTIWSWTGGVPNVFLSNRADGTGVLDLIWAADPMTAYNIADLCLHYGIWAMFMSIGIYAVRFMHELATTRQTSIPHLAGGGILGTPAGDLLRANLCAGRRDGLGQAFARTTGAGGEEVHGADRGGQALETAASGITTS